MGSQIWNFELSILNEPMIRPCNDRQMCGTILLRGKVVVQFTPTYESFHSIDLATDYSDNSYNEPSSQIQLEKLRLLVSQDCHFHRFSFILTDETFKTSSSATVKTKNGHREV